jgi:CheY-like chemotaxis protein/anti-sigma regulatory factor (Ser/Thr protein kinase)
MTAILGFAELLGDEGVDAAERSEYIETIRRNGDHLLAIINDILDLAKIEAGGCTLDIAEVVAPDIVRDVVQLLHMRAVAKGISLVKEIQGDAAMLPIRSDAVRIRQVLLNLVGNAVKFTDQGSVRVVVSAQRSGSRVETRIAVHDTGCGMSEETIPKLFEPFSQFDSSYTRRHGGTGLGLAISRPLAVLLGGRIDVASELGRGSVFTLIFESEVAEPALVFPVPTPSTPAPRSANGPLSGKNILLVEDSIDSQRILSALMSLAGARVDIASDGLSAVARFDGVYCPDLVIMDVQMPGIDGIEATERIRARGYRGRIVALTAAALSVERDRALNAGCEGFYLKPISRTDLLAICVGNQATLD